MSFVRTLASSDDKLLEFGTEVPRAFEFSLDAHRPPSESPAEQKLEPLKHSRPAINQGKVRPALITLNLVRGCDLATNVFLDDVVDQATRLPQPQGSPRVVPCRAVGEARCWKAKLNEGIRVFPMAEKRGSAVVL